jgi:putative heme-binding domain-containing protein
MVGIGPGFAPLSRIGRVCDHLLVSPAGESQGGEAMVGLVLLAVLGAGDPARGARVFYAPAVACARCHEGIDGAAPLGPDLTALGRGVTEEQIAESILHPSKQIKAGYETVTIVTTDGATITGVDGGEGPGGRVVRSLGADGRVASTTVPGERIEAFRKEPISAMPAGLAEQLADKNTLQDLVAYVKAVADGGKARATELRPDAVSLIPVLPAYEKTLDHAGLLKTWGPESYRRGEAIYGRVCANCHGTLDQPGSLPTAPRFAAAAFKNGSDPFRLYQTLTHGYGLMTPQTWMVPSQKYDVIHYLRETFLKEQNPSKYQKVDEAYLASLPRGSSRGPAPSLVEPWRIMDYGPSLTAAYEVARGSGNFAYKGVAVRLDEGPGGIARGRAWALYDHDTMRLVACWTGSGFIDWESIHFNGRHAIHPALAGKLALANPGGPGWADPNTGSFDDPRHLGRDGLPYGPLPKRWSTYKGLFHHGNRTILSYKVGEAEILDAMSLEEDAGAKGTPIFARTLHVGPSGHALLLRVAPAKVSAVVIGAGELAEEEGVRLLRLPASSTSRDLKILMSDQPLGRLDAYASRFSPPVESLPALTKGGPARWTDTLTTRTVRGADTGPFAMDLLTHPERNPWNSRLRLSGLDFSPDGRSAYLCDWDGDAWRVDGLLDPAGVLRWRRVASGMFQPLGLKVVNGDVYITCRDQIVILRDINGDGETDFYECFNNDQQVTEHFHEFAMDLQTDARGNFYYARAGRHALPAVVPQHGTLIRVSKDGSKTEILARGFRAPNGVCINDDGTFFLTDQEGFWLPKNRINWVKPGGFYGNLWGYQDVTDPSNDAMEPPICWVTNAFDRSPAEIIKVESPKWGALNGSYLNTSYGYGKFYLLLKERVGDLMQGGMVGLPLPRQASGVMRGRFHPIDQQLYACGMFAWAGSQEQPGGFYRLRATGQPARLPTGLKFRKGKIILDFTDPIDPASVADLSRFGVKVWSLRRTARYGSKHYDEHPLAVQKATLSPDGKALTLTVPDLAPTWGIEVVYAMKAPGGAPVEGVIHGSIHRLDAP